MRRVLAEVIFWIITPCRLDHRRLGYLSAAISLWTRGRRVRRDWSAHETAARTAILEAADALANRRTCVVLGSGLLRDVPLDDLAKRFQRVVLIDVIHLWPARLQARRHANVELLESDLTGTTDLLLGRATGIADPFARLRLDPAIDLTISATCLSQLPLGPEAVIEAARRRPPYIPRDLGRRIVSAHLDGLARMPGRVCLITDTEVLTRNRSGDITEREDLLEGVPLPTPDRNWTWPVAPFGEYAKDEELVHQVHAYLNFGLARRTV